MRDSKCQASALVRPGVWLPNRLHLSKIKNTELVFHQQSNISKNHFTEKSEFHPGTGPWSWIQAPVLGQKWSSSPEFIIKCGHCEGGIWWSSSLNLDKPNTFLAARLREKPSCLLLLYVPLKGNQLAEDRQLVWGAREDMRHTAAWQKQQGKHVFHVKHLSLLWIHHPCRLAGQSNSSEIIWIIWILQN